MPVIKVNLQFAQLDEIAKANGFLKYVPPVYRDHPALDFADRDFELRVRDKIFLQEVELSEGDFERVVDCLEKVAFMYRDT